MCGNGPGPRSGAEHLGKLGGTSTGEARRAIANSRAVVALPEVTGAMRAGALSGAQVDAIVPAAAADRFAQARLVGLAQTTNVTELREECLRTKAGADPDPEATHTRIHENRRQQTHTDAEGAWNLRARGTAEQGTAFEARLEPIIDEVFAKARTDGRWEPRAAYAFDALMLLGRRVGHETKKSPKQK